MEMHPPPSSSCAPAPAPAALHTPMHPHASSPSPCTHLHHATHTGLYGQSSVRKVAVNTGQVLQSVSLPDKWFGEGLVRLGDYLYQVSCSLSEVFTCCVYRCVNVSSFLGSCGTRCLTAASTRMLHAPWRQC